MASSSASPPRDPSPRWFAEHAHRWVEAGLVTREQAAAIVRLETGPTPLAPPGLSLVAEVSAYLGSVLALVGGAVVVSRSWQGLGITRVVIGLGIAAIAFLAGREIELIPGDGAQRLCGFLWLVGAGGVALGLATGGDELGLEPGVTALLVGAVLAGLGAGLWRNRSDRPLQLLTLVAGVGIALLAVRELSDIDVARWVLGLALGGASLLVGFLAVRGRLRPETWVLVLAGAGCIVGSAMLGDLAVNLGIGAALASAAGVMAVGLWRQEVAVTVLGIVGFLEALIVGLGHVLQGPGAIVVLVVGVVTLLAVIARAMHHPPPVGPTP